MEFPANVHSLGTNENGISYKRGEFIGFHWDLVAFHGIYWEFMGRNNNVTTSNIGQIKDDHGITIKNSE